jgi:RNA polymerase sigma factor (sigma-70 family)
MPAPAGPNDPFGSISTQWTLLEALDGPEADAAWREFVGRYRPFVRGVLQRAVARPEQVAPAETDFWGYVYLSDALRRADRGRRFRPYLSGIVQNFARSWTRRHEATGDETASGVAARPTAGAEEAELTAWARNVLALALAGLGEEMPPAAAALRAFYGLDDANGVGLDASAVAARLGVSLTNVYQLLSRGRRRLRALVEAELRAGCGDAAEVADELRTLLQNLRTQHPGLLGD